MSNCFHSADIHGENKMPILSTEMVVQTLLRMFKFTTFVFSLYMQLTFRITAVNTF